MYEIKVTTHVTSHVYLMATPVIQDSLYTTGRKEGIHR